MERKELLGLFLPNSIVFPKIFSPRKISSRSNATCLIKTLPLHPEQKLIALKKRATKQLT